jgi:hypothetical protein
MKTLEMIQFITKNPKYNLIVIGGYDDMIPMDAIYQLTLFDMNTVWNHKESDDASDVLLVWSTK